MVNTTYSNMEYEITEECLSFKSINTKSYEFL